MTQELNFGGHNSDSTTNSELSAVVSVSIADPYVLLKMTDGSIQLLVGGIIAEFNVFFMNFFNPSYPMLFHSNKILIFILNKLFLIMFLWMHCFA